MNMIETKNLKKTYGDFTAVEGINLHIKKGSVYGFLGPNGAGKSTLARQLAEETDKAAVRRKLDTCLVNLEELRRTVEALRLSLDE